MSNPCERTSRLSWTFWGRASAPMSRASPASAHPAVQFDAAVIEARCQAAAKGTRRTGTRARPRSHTARGSAATARSQRGGASLRFEAAIGQAFRKDWVIGLGLPAAPACAGPHAGVEEPHERVEAVVGRADDEPALRSREEPPPRRVAAGAPFGVGRSVGLAALERHQAAGGGVVRRDRHLGRQLPLPGVVHAESHGLVAPAEDGPALGLGPRGKVPEPEEHAVLRGRAGDEAPGDLGLGAAERRGRAPDERCPGPEGRAPPPDRAPPAPRPSGGAGRPMSDAAAWRIAPRPRTGSRNTGPSGMAWTNPTRSPLTAPRSITSPASSRSASLLDCAPEPKTRVGESSRTRSSVTSLSSVNFFRYGSPRRAVTFQSMSRTSSPNWYRTTWSNSMPRPRKAERYWPLRMFSTAWRSRHSSCLRSASGLGTWLFPGSIRRAAPA